MTTRVQTTFEITSWDETAFDDGAGKLTEAVVGKRFSKGVDGTSTTKWLMAYAPDGTATCVGLERIRGAVLGRRGTLVLLHDGTFANGVAAAGLRVVSGTDELVGVTGTGTFTADPTGSMALDLEGL